jgi:hypothetical protein
MMQQVMRADHGGNTSRPGLLQAGLSMGFRGLAAICLCFAAANALGANHFVTVSGSGSKTGADWNNAWAGKPASYVRGDTYYFSAGSYSALTLSTAGSGTTVITLKGATAADHGTDTGWSSSMAGQALFTGQTTINSPYWVINGQTRGADWRSGYTMKFWNTSIDNVSAITLNSGADNVSLSYLEVEGTAGNVQSSTGEDYCVGQGGNVVNNLYIGYSYLHDSGNSQIDVNYGNGDGITVEYCYIYRNHLNNNGEHDEAIASSMSDMVIRFNIFGDIMWTAFIANATGYTGNMANWSIYGNVFYWDSLFQNASYAFVGNGVVGLPSNVSGGALTGIYYFYNNTIVGIKSNTGDRKSTRLNSSHP